MAASLPPRPRTGLVPILVALGCGAPRPEVQDPPPGSSPPATHESTPQTAAPAEPSEIRLPEGTKLVDLSHTFDEQTL